MYGHTDHWIRFPAWSFLLVFYRNHSPEVRRFFDPGDNRQQCLFQASFGGGDSTPKLTISSPPNGCQTVGSKSFFSAGTMKYKYITETFVSIDNKHRKLFVIKQTKGCLKFVWRPNPLRLCTQARGGEAAYL